MEKYKSQYPTLRQAKTKWSSQKDPYATPHLGWVKKATDFQHSGPKIKLLASVIAARMGIVHQKIREEVDGEHIYHVTHTKHVDKIRKHGILPMQTSNWVKAGDKDRYGGGEVYAFTHKADAHAWAGRMDWAHHQKLGSGKISIVTAKRPADRKFEVDNNDPLSQAGKKGDWLKTHGSIEPHHIVSVEPYHPKKLGEDKIGKQTPSAEEIAKKHGLTLDQVNAQLDKGKSVEREHTNSDEEAHEIARDHVHEFPDYYDRLDKMEKKAKKDMKEELTDDERRRLHSFKDPRKDKEAQSLGYKDHAEREMVKRLHSFKDGRSQQDRKRRSVKEGWDPEVEHIRNTIDSHKKVAEKMAQHHGEQSQEAAFHRAYVKHLTKQLKDVHGLDEEVANSVGGGMSPVIGGEGNIHGMDPIMGKPIRRRKFAGKQVFVVDPTTYHKAYLGKRKYEHYEKYLEGSPHFEEIRAYGRKHWDEPIILENEQTGAMVYLKYGSK